MKEKTAEINGISQLLIKKIRAFDESEKQADLLERQADELVTKARQIRLEVSEFRRKVEEIVGSPEKPRPAPAKAPSSERTEKTGQRETNRLLLKKALESFKESGEGFTVKEFREELARLHDSPIEPARIRSIGSYLSKRAGNGTLDCAGKGRSGLNIYSFPATAGAKIKPSGTAKLSRDDIALLEAAQGLAQNRSLVTQKAMGNFLIQKGFDPGAYSRISNFNGRIKRLNNLGLLDFIPVKGKKAKKECRITELGLKAIENKAEPKDKPKRR